MRRNRNRNFSYSLFKAFLTVSQNLEQCRIEFHSVILAAVPFGSIESAWRCRGKSPWNTSPGFEPRKKCRYCNFKKRSCFFNPHSCKAKQLRCYSCLKMGHFPQSLNCKARKFVNRRIREEKNKIIDTLNNVNKQSENCETNMIIDRLALAS